MFYSVYASARLFSVATESNSPTNKWIVAANIAFISTTNQVRSTEIKNKIKEIQIRTVKVVSICEDRKKPEQIVHMSKVSTIKY